MISLVRIPLAAPPFDLSFVQESVAGEVNGGPPLRGSPWLRLLPLELGPLDAVVVPNPPDPTPVGIPTEFTLGPPMIGSPWFKPMLLPPGVFPAQVGVPRSKGKPFVPRVPDLKGPDAQNRMRRHTELVSSIINSLSGQGFIRLTGQNVYSLLAGAFFEGAAPGTTDDVDAGAIPGCFWLDLSSDTLYFCMSNARAAAVWIALSSTSGGGFPGGLTGTYP